MVYVANYGSNTTSVIDGSTDRVVAGVTFNIIPANSGHILCNNQEFPLELYVYVRFGTKCIAQANKGFVFSSWTENLGHMSSQTVNISSTDSGSLFNTLINPFLDIRDSGAVFTVKQHGKFTANFQEPPVPPEYWASLFTVVATALVGSLLIPASVGWFKSKRQTSRLNSYHRDITDLYNDGKLDERDTVKLNTLNNKLINAYSGGKVNNEQYTNLKNEISILYEEIYNKKIESLIYKDSNGTLLDEVKNDIKDAYAKGKISELYFIMIKL
jgi:YVTN family beta-propeller protein